MNADQTTTRDTIAADLTLLLFQPDSGTIAGEGTLYYVLAGAVVTDLAMRGLITAENAGLRGSIVRATGDDGPDDDILRPAWQYIAEKPRGVQTVLAAIGPNLREPVLDRLVERGEIVRARGKALGFIPTEKLSLGDSSRRARLVAQVRAVLVDGAIPDARTGALVALVSASDTLPYLDREIPWTSAVATRAAQFERGEWGADAAASAVTRTMTAITVDSVVTSLVAANVIAAR